MISSIINGRPTRTQVDLLLRKLRDSKEGDILKHEEIAALIGEPKSSRRYQTIINSAKQRLLREAGLSLESERHVGYRICTGSDQIRHGVKIIRGGVKRIGFGHRVVAAISDDRLPDGPERKTRDFIVQQATTLAEIARTQNKSIHLTLGKTQALPHSP